MCEYLNSWNSKYLSVASFATNRSKVKIVFLLILTRMCMNNKVLNFLFIISLWPDGKAAFSVVKKLD